MGEGEEMEEDVGEGCIQGWGVGLGVGRDSVRGRGDEMGVGMGEE